MRFRVTTSPPLPITKAWFFIPDNPQFPQPIAVLKEDLCLRIPPLADQNLSGKDLCLTLEGFELLDESEANLIRENDLVCITLRPGQRTNKRAAEQDRTLLPPAKRSKKAHSAKPSRVHSPSESGSTSSSESSSSDSESESSSSDSSDASDSDTSSSVQNPPKPILLGVKPASTSLRLKATTNAQSLIPNKHVSLGESSIPPGKGKSSTHARNARRKRRRDAQREAAEMQPPPSQQSAANSTPLGSGIQSNLTSSSEVDELLVAPPAGPPVLQDSGNTSFEPVFSSSLRNKNKRTNSKRSSASTIPARIVFDFTPDQTGVPPPAKPQHSRLVTPYEKQHQGLIPKNIFVTSVNLEPFWDRDQKHMDANVGFSNDYDAQRHDDDIQLDYGSSEIDEKKQLPPSLDWDSIALKWESYLNVSSAYSLTSELIVGWKALGIHPVARTPEMLLHLARIVRVDPCDSNVTIQYIARPGGEEPSGEDIISFQDVVSGNWKIIVTP